MLVLMGLFVGLGAWQVERLGEKERLIASVAARADLPPIALPPVAEWGAFDPETFGFRAVTLTGQWLPQQTVLVFTSLEAPKRREIGPGLLGDDAAGAQRRRHRLSSIVATSLRNRPLPSSSAARWPDGEVTLTGVARAGRGVGAFTPGPDAAHRIDYVRDPERLPQLRPHARRPRRADSMSICRPVTRVHCRRAARPSMEFPNNHLGYAMTWFGFALLVPPLLILWVRRQRRVIAKP